MSLLPSVEGEVNLNPRDLVDEPALKGWSIDNPCC